MHRNLLIKTFFILSISVILFACHRNNSISLPGYIEGQYTYISPLIGGTIKNIYVKSGDNVTVNQPLFVLEEFPENKDLETAAARLQEGEHLKIKASENYALQKSIYERKYRLYQQGVIPKDKLEAEKAKLSETESELKSNEQNISALLAAKQKAEWSSKQKTVSSPVNSIVFDVYYTSGELVPNQTPVISLLTPNKIKIIFFAPEKMLSQLKPNQKVEVYLDGRNKPITAQINYISNQAQYTPPIIYSTDVRQTLVYRIEAAPIVDNINLYHLHPGQPVTVEYNFP